MMTGGNGITRVLRLFFGIFMVLVYLVMAYLLAVNFFDWTTTPLWNTVRWAMAVLLGLYGVFRCYRQISGKDYYRNREEL